MTSKKYWEMRSAQDMVDRMGTAEQTAAEMNKAISQSAEYIAKEVKTVFRGLESFGISEAEAKKILNAANNKTALQSLRAAARRVSDPEKRAALLKAIDSAGAYRYRIDRLEQLNKQINAECCKLYKTENRAVTSALKTAASDSYYHSIFNIQQATGLGFSFAEFSQKDIDRILHANWLGGNYSQRIWKNVSDTAEAVKRELLVSMLSGRSSGKTARTIRERFGVNSYCARRIVRTESAYVANAAQMSAYDEAGIEKYRFVATLDSRTSEACAALDGKVFPASEAKAGTNYPPMHPFCRSTTIADFGVEQLKRLERRARDKDGNVVRVSGNMTYEEWVKGLDKSGESGIINSRRLTIKIDLQYFAIIPEDKFTKYALDPIKQPDKARAFHEALGYTMENYQELIDNIDRNFDRNLMVFKGNNGHGDLYQLVMRIKGANGKEANVCTGWIIKNGETEPRLTSAYVTKKEVTHRNED